MRKLIAVAACAALFAATAVTATAAGPPDRALGFYGASLLGYSVAAPATGVPARISYSSALEHCVAPGGAAVGKAALNARNAEGAMFTGISVAVAATAGAGHTQTGSPYATTS